MVTPIEPAAPVRSPAPAAAYKWYLVAMLWGISFFNYADRQAIFSVFPLLEQEMNLGPEQLGLLISSFAWVYGLSAPLAGFIVDRVRRKTAILAGLQVWSLICMATALSQRFWQLVMFRAAEGLGETIYYPASVSMLSDYHGPRTRSRALGWHQTSVYIGMIAGGSLAGYIGENYGWRWSFIVFGGLGVILGLVLHRALIEPRRGAAEDAGRAPAARLSFAQVLLLAGRTPTVLLLMAGFVCANFAAVVLYGWTTTFLTRHFDMKLGEAAVTATVYVQLPSFAGAILGGGLADRWRQHFSGGRILTQALGVLAAAPFAFWCGRADSRGFVIAMLVGWGLFKGVYDANIFASVFDVVRPEARGSLAGLMNMVGWLGGGFGGWVIGRLAKEYGLGRAISLSAVVYIASGLFLLVAGVIFIRRDAARFDAGLVKSEEH